MDRPREHDHSGDGHFCCASDNSAVRQTLSEMEFERGIWFAAQHNDSGRVERLLEKGTSPNIEDSAGYTALHYAARNGHLGVCELLLRNGAEVNAATRCGKATALHRASSQGHANVVQLLLKHKADANLRDADGCTALHRAVAAASLSVCELLVPCTDLKVTDNGGRTVRRLAEEKFTNALPLIGEREKQRLD